MIQKLKEWSVGALMLGTSAAALIGGTQEENYTITPENFHVEMMSSAFPNHRAQYEQGDFSLRSGEEKNLDKQYYIMGKVMQAIGSTKKQPDESDTALIQKQYEMLEKAFVGVKNFHQVRENYFKIWEMCGKPALADKENQSFTTKMELLFTGDKNRACYNSIINEIYNPKGTYYDQMQEMAHAYYQKHASQFLGVLVDNAVHPLTDQKETYNLVNLTEFNTHACVEPILKDCVLGRISPNHIEPEVVRRLDISEKLADAGIERIPQSIASALIADISHHFAKNGWSKDGSLALDSGDSYQGLKEDTLLDAHTQEKGLMEMKLVAYQLSQLKAGRIKSSEAFFDGLAQMKNTLNKIMGNEQTARIATNAQLTVDDVAVLATLGKSGHDMTASLMRGNTVNLKNDIISRTLNQENITDISPVHLEMYFVMRNQMPAVTIGVSNDKKPNALAPSGTLKQTLHQAENADTGLDAVPQKTDAKQASLSVVTRKQAQERG